ncbi:DNA-directed RNA polymerase subunit beta [Sporosarcina siberiensis]|uniref:DNA-directed RNA polymerase subunit beta n=1 Tax=Sporosarcina siberiensis TaxID=1365606 RepID=A0ABW4SL17_9BACL
MNDENRTEIQLNKTDPPKAPITRAERNRLKTEGKEVRPKRTLWVQIRILPIWLRILLVAVLIVGAIALGVTIGYGYMGDGNPADALKKETWVHILDIMSGKQ